MRISGNEELGTMAENNPLTGYEPNFIDNYHISETTDIFIQVSSSDGKPLSSMTAHFQSALFTTVSKARRSSEL